MYPNSRPLTQLDSSHHRRHSIPTVYLVHSSELYDHLKGMQSATKRGMLDHVVTSTCHVRPEVRRSSDAIGIIPGKKPNLGADDALVDFVLWRVC